VQRDRDWVAQHYANIEPCSDRNEEQAKQQALEGLDGDFDLAAELSFREQQPRDKGAKAHRKARRSAGDAGADHHQKARRHEQFGGSRRRHQTKQRPQQQPSAKDQCAEHGQRRQEGPENCDAR
jgi:hypothetical protein